MILKIFHNNSSFCFTVFSANINKYLRYAARQTVYFSYKNISILQILIYSGIYFAAGMRYLSPVSSTIFFQYSFE